MCREGVVNTRTYIRRKLTVAIRGDKKLAGRCGQVHRYSLRIIERRLPPAYEATHAVINSRVTIKINASYLINRRVPKLFRTDNVYRRNTRAYSINRNCV